MCQRTSLTPGQNYDYTNHAVWTTHTQKGHGCKELLSTTNRVKIDEVKKNVIKSR